MNVITESEARTTTTPGGVMKALAGPSQGSEQVSTWRVDMGPHSSSPEHMVDRDQVWMPVSGGFQVMVEEEHATLSPGQAVVIPAGALRRVSTGDTPGEALVCMVPGGRACVPGREGALPLPWAD